VGEEQHRRGTGCARAGRVTGLQTEGGGQVLTAAVRGTAHRPYRTEVAATCSGWSGTCSCPVGVDCKHVAAVLVAAQQGLGGRAQRPGRQPAPPPTAGWERALGDLVRPAQPSPPVRGTPLGLQVEALARPAGRVAAVGQRSYQLRPVVRGASGRWVRTRVSWRKVADPYVHAYAGFAGGHASALRALHSAHQAALPPFGYSYGEAPVLLEEVGPTLWPVLRQVVDAGVEVVSASGAPVTLAEEPAAATVDLRREHVGTDDADGLVRAVVAVGGAAVPAEGLDLLGDPPHGVVVDGGDGGLLLAPLSRPAAAPLARLLRSGVVRVPAGDLDRFLRDFYPALRRLVPVTSSDGSVALPEVAPPRLVLHVDHATRAGEAPTGVVAVRWSVQHETGGRVRRLPLGAEDGDPLRDPAAEEALVRAVRPGTAALPQLLPPGRGAPPPHVELRGMDAVALAEHVLPALRERDDVLVELTGDAPGYRRTDAAPVVALSATEPGEGQPDGRTDWFDLGVTVSVDGEEVPFAVLFTALAAGESHLVLPSGTWFAIQRPELEHLRRLIEEAHALQDRERPGLRISRYQAGLWQELVELGVVAQQSRRWEQDVRGLLDVDTADPPPLPDGLSAQLRPYQVQGYQWLSFLWDAGLGGVLADDMGLGKTLQTLALLCRAKAAGQLDAPALVVAPTSVVANWAREAARFTPGLRVATLAATERRRGAPLAEAVAGADLVVTSYALLRLEEEAYRSLPWSALVLDEAQFVKNHQAKTHAVARRLPARVKLAITGTPLENSLMDLWALLSIVAPGLFPNPQRFTDFYRTPIERGTDPQRLVALRRRIRPLVLRRIKEQVAAELPPKQEQVLEVVLNPRHRALYDRHLQQERRKVLGLVGDLQRNRFAVLTAITKLRQLSLDPALADDASAGVRSSKADAFLEHLQEVVAEQGVAVRLNPVIHGVTATVGSSNSGLAIGEGHPRQRRIR
jgi:hypothetical protein